MSKNIQKLFIFLIISLSLTSVFSQTDTRYDAGKNLPFNTKAGDVNPQTGNLTVSAVDVELPGRAGFNFVFGRIWSLNQSNVFNMTLSANGTDGINCQTIDKLHRLGTGWTSTLPVIYKDLSTGTPVLNLFFNGSVYQIDTNGILNPDSPDSNLLWYDLKDLRIHKSEAIAYSDFTLYPFSSFAGGYEITDLPGHRSYYRLTLKDNSHYWFRHDGQLMMQEDRTGLNRIWYFYDADGKLRLVYDTLGRPIAFIYDGNGSMSRIEWTVRRMVKHADGNRTNETTEMSVNYTYTSAEAFSEVLRLKNRIAPSDYRTSYALSTVTNAQGLVTKYDWDEKPVKFSYTDSGYYAENVFLTLADISNVYTPDGVYKNKRVFEYTLPNSRNYRKPFYNGYMEYVKLSRQYYLNRQQEINQDTLYYYYDDGEAGNVNQYTAVIQQANITTVYTYSLDAARNKKDVLASLLVKSKDGFLQETVYSYDNERRKTYEEVKRQGRTVYNEKYSYDLKGNLLDHTDRLRLRIKTDYDPDYSIPVSENRIFSDNGVVQNYLITRNLKKDSQGRTLGLVDGESLFVSLPGETDKKEIKMARYVYDIYGNVTAKTDALGNTVYTDYDGEFHTFPVKIYQTVDIARFNGGTVHEKWLEEPVGTESKVIRSFKVFNTDGTVWLEIDNEGYAVEHYYDLNRQEIETVNPDGNDSRNFDLSLLTQNGMTLEVFIAAPGTEDFLSLRADNPGTRLIIDYQNEFVRTEADIDVSTGSMKVAGIQKDGLGNTLKEIEYDEFGAEYSVKKMTYNNRGLMVALTDADAGTRFTTITVNGKKVEKYDKTWLISYDDLGRKKFVYYPQTADGKSAVKMMKYNDLENSITTVDPEGRKVYQQYDWQGNEIKTVRYGDILTRQDEVQEYRYTYDPLGRKRSFTDAQGIVTGYRYDERSLLTEETYGTSGSDRMEYNDLGQLIKKTDRNQNVILFSYDQLGRNTRADHYRTVKTGTTETLQFDHTVEICYDNRGNAVRIANPNLIEHYIYDWGNRVIQLERRLKDAALRSSLETMAGFGTADTQIFSYQYQYNDLGLVKQMTYPDGAVHEFTYDESLARLQKIREGDNASTITDFVSAIEYNKSGVVTAMDYANGAGQTWEFDTRKRISRIRITGTEGVISDLHYTLNGSGDILAINSNEYKYDGFDRITGAKTLIPGNTDLRKLVLKYFGTRLGGAAVNGVTYNPEADIYPEDNPDGRINGQDHFFAVRADSTRKFDVESFSYDKKGNRTKLIQNGDEYTYQYGALNQLLTVYRRKKGELTKSEFIKYTYDANGNTVKRTIKPDASTAETTMFVYDTLNRLTKTTTETKNGTQVTTAIQEYFYDNAGNRFIKKDNTGNTTVYLRHGQIAVALDVELLFDNTTDKAVVNRYVLSGDLLAGRITKTIHLNGTAEVKTYYYHLDHLNSTKCVTDETGKLNVLYEYRAFGEELKKLGTGDAKYTYGGKELDEGINLYYFNARYYDATIGRFINVDPVQDGVNWYVYCNNNPICFQDPTGLNPMAVLLGAVGGAVLGVATQAVADAFSGKTSSLGTYLGAAAGGAVYGAVLVSTANPVLAGAAGGAISGLVSSFVDKKDLKSTVIDTAVSTGVGAATGLIPGSRVPAVTAGKGSMAAVTKTLETKLANGTIKNISVKSAAKMATSKMIQGAAIEGAVLASPLVPKISDGVHDFVDKVMPDKIGSDNSQTTVQKAEIRQVKNND